MIGLVFFQYKWINHSRKLSEEIFNQRASMALCSTLEDYGGGTSCSEASCAVACGKEESLLPAYSDFVGRPEIVENESFQADLRKTLDFYNIDLSWFKHLV